MGPVRTAPVPPIEVDLAGKCICPGLVDCHDVHITAVPGSKSPADMARERQETV
ncbi:uncharacterized protein C8Q71DRAFT_755227 [Rhodofomes roseus]|uniref:Amidohydrolase family protein n=1 Tax=Rhodofomes roseus TaxID=34475 RepID=A0ABQ8KK06_9APHY|nr:uncharacterized protein C8Q71DRAFT_755227 [Rhodofomes roseus]KAH9837922.1 hypothetical protein C8Q71DRAFT_755227 [Rhodofomes roseus]